MENRKRNPSKFNDSELKFPKRIARDARYGRYLTTVNYTFISSVQLPTTHRPV